MELLFKFFINEIIKAFFFWVLNLFKGAYHYKFVLKII
jgi:hypothetical protein